MTSTFTHSDMQWVFVHHLLRNEELLESCGLAEDLQRSNAYFEELNRIRQGTLNYNETQEPSFTYQCESGDMIPNSELSESAALLEKIHQMQEKVNRREYLDKETVRHVIDVTQKSVKDVEERAAKVWNFIYEQCQKRLAIIRSQLNHVQKLSDAIASWTKLRKKTIGANKNIM
ncbi:hypothetical protein V3C99_016026 [Haemonchus contortus]